MQFVGVELVGNSSLHSFDLTLFHSQFVVKVAVLAGIPMMHVYVRQTQFTVMEVGESWSWGSRRHIYVTSWKIYEIREIEMKK